jgi:hypothetical protein
MSQKLDCAQLRRRRPWTAEEGRAVVMALRGSGESLAAFSRSRGLGAERVRWWCKRVREAKATQESVSLLPVAIIGSGGAGAAMATFDVLVAGVVVRVPPDFDEGALRRLVRALTPC